MYFKICFHNQCRKNEIYISAALEMVTTLQTLNIYLHQGQIINSLVW